jgi:hypothetical protein
MSVVVNQAVNKEIKILSVASAYSRDRELSVCLRLTARVL